MRLLTIESGGFTTAVGARRRSPEAGRSVSECLELLVPVGRYVPAQPDHQPTADPSPAIEQFPRKPWRQERKREDCLHIAGRDPSLFGDGAIRQRLTPSPASHANRVPGIVLSAESDRDPPRHRPGSRHDHDVQASPSRRWSLLPGSLSRPPPQRHRLPVSPSRFRHGPDAPRHARSADAAASADKHAPSLPLGAIASCTSRSIVSAGTRLIVPARLFSFCVSAWLHSRDSACPCAVIV